MSRIVLLNLWLILGLATTALAQNQTLTGKVTDQRGSGLPGVSVLVKGTNQGSTTDAEGNYQVTVPANAKVGFSFIGFLTQEVAIGNRTTVNISLQEDTRQLEEVVVSGLATNVKRSNLANAVTTLSAKTLTGVTTPVTTDGALQGKLAGANIQANGSIPGGGFNVQLRGVSTLGSSASQPLYIVDGVYIDNGQYTSGRSDANKAGAGSSTASQDNNGNRLADLNPDDIENIEVLKGSSAAAIYGTRANAGVVIITTKRGKGGRTNVSFGQDLGFSNAYSYYGGADWTAEKLTNYFSTTENADGTPNPAGIAALNAEIAKLNAAKQNGTYTDWEKVVYGETGSIKNTRLSVAGGNDKTRFYVNGSIANETGIIKNTGFKRYSIRANIDHQLNNWIDFGISSNYVNSDNDRGWTGNDNSNINYGYSLPYTRPYDNLYPDANGVYPDNSSRVGENPLAIRDRAVNNQKVNRFIQGFNANFRLINSATSSLTLKVNGGLDYQSGFATIWLPTDLQSQRAEPNPGFSQDTRSEIFNSNIQVAGVFTYAAMGGKLNLTTSAGAVRLHRDFRYNFTRGRKLPVGVSNPARGGVQEIGTEYQRNTDVGLFVQQEANYDDKLIGTVGVRFDKSTLNGDNYDKFYAFPKASLAVNLTRFGSWAASSGVISQLKPRIAYGSTAGLASFGTPYSQLTVTGIGGLSGLIPSTVLGNAQIEPERATELEYGLDFGLFNNRITGEFTLYNKKVIDLIQPLTTAPTTGVTSTNINAADLTNRGLEFTLGAEVLRSQAVTWFVQPIFWFNRSEITRLDIPERLTGGFGATFGQWRVKEGESPTQIVGQPRTNPADLNSFTVYGDQQPKYEFSLNQRVTFLKNFELSALFHYRHKFTVVSLQRVLWDEGGNTSDWNSTSLGLPGNGTQGTVNGAPVNAKAVPLEAADAAAAIAPNGIARQNVNGREFTGTVDGTFILGQFVSNEGYNPNVYRFLKMREASLYYRVPKTALQSVFRNYVQGVRIGVSGTNLLRFTDYKAGYDPENSNFGSLALGSGVDIGSAPLARRVMFHIAIDL